MNEQLDLEKIKQSTFNETMIDGTTEILAGIMLLFTPFFYRFPFIVVLVPIILFYWRPVLEAVRERTTYPRIGRIELIQEEEKEDFSSKKFLLTFLLFIAGALFVTYLAMMLIEEDTSNIQMLEKWGPFFFGLVMFGPSLYLVEETGKPLYYLIGVFTTITGLIFSTFSFLDGLDNLTLYFITLGVVSLMVGILRYVLFIREYPIIVLEED